MGYAVINYNCFLLFNFLCTIRQLDILWVEWSAEYVFYVLELIIISLLLSFIYHILIYRERKSESDAVGCTCNGEFDLNYTYRFWEWLFESKFLYLLLVHQNLRHLRHLICTTIQRFWHTTEFVVLNLFIKGLYS